MCGTAQQRTNRCGSPHERLVAAGMRHLACAMGAILQMPPEVRAARFSRALHRFVIAGLRAVKREGGDQALNRTARDLIISVCAIIAYERGTDAVVDLFGMIDRVLADDQN